MAIPEEIQRQVLEEATEVTPNFDIDQNDARFGKVESDKAQALTENEQLYGGMIGKTDQFYDAQIQASKDWADKQTQLQQDRTDFAIEQIEQQKEQTHKDYLKEQSGAYVDWQKQSNKYGVEAERQASAGLTGTGFAESSQVSMYNTYQNRVMTAWEIKEKAILNYNNAIKDAMLQNNAALAEIAFNTLQKQLELALQGFQHKNDLVIQQANKKLEIDNVYYNRYMDVLDQINHENDVKRDIWKYKDTQKWQTEQAQIERDFKAGENEKQRTFEAEEARIKREFDAKQAEIDRKHDLALIEANTKAAKEKADYEYKLEMQKLEKEKEIELAIMAQELANDKSLASYTNSLKSSSGGSGGSGGYSGGGSSGGGGGVAQISGGYAVNTAYYQGAKNSDASKYGTFSNGYQPKGISGHGKLTKTGDTITFNTKTLSGQKQTVTQNVWKAEDGTKWYWDGRVNKYLKV